MIAEFIMNENKKTKSEILKKIRIKFNQMKLFYFTCVIKYLKETGFLQNQFHYRKFFLKKYINYKL